MKKLFLILILITLPTAVFSFETTMRSLESELKTLSSKEKNVMQGHEKELHKRFLLEQSFNRSIVGVSQPASFSESPSATPYKPVFDKKNVRSKIDSSKSEEQTKHPKIDENVEQTFKSEEKLP